MSRGLRCCNREICDCRQVIGGVGENFDMEKVTGSSPVAPTFTTPCRMPT